MHGWHVIIAASGMCDAGRVRHHLKRLLWREDATVLLTGYQAIGTLGRLLQEGRKAVRIQGDDIKVRARMRSIDVYSGHADALGLIAWAKARAPRGSIFLNHGEPENIAGLAKRLAKAGFAENRIVQVELDQSYRLKPSARPEPEPRASRLPAKAVAALDWHNQRSEFLARLNARLEQSADNDARERLLASLEAQLRADAGSKSAGQSAP
jgi:metallo-beta-lactamase family protein